MTDYVQLTSRKYDSVQTKPVAEQTTVGDDMEGSTQSTPLHFLHLDLRVTASRVVRTQMSTTIYFVLRYKITSAFGFAPKGDFSVSFASKKKKEDFSLRHWKSIGS